MNIKELDPQTYIQKLKERQDGGDSPVLKKAEELVRAGKPKAAAALLTELPLGDLTLGCHLTNEETRVLEPNEDYLPRFMEDAFKAKESKPEPKAAKEPKAGGGGA